MSVLTPDPIVVPLLTVQSQPIVERLLAPADRLTHVPYLIG